MNLNYILRLVAYTGVFVATQACSQLKDVAPQGDKDNTTISEGDITIINDAQTLSKSVKRINNPLTFQNFVSGASVANTEMTAMNAGNGVSIQAAYTPDLTDAIKAEGNKTYSINNRETYYIAEGETFTGQFWFNSPGKIIVLGTLAGDNTLNIPKDGVVEVAPSGAITTAKVRTNENGASLVNYGNVIYLTSSSNGNIDNYGTLVFTEKSFSLNKGSVTNNYCKIEFVGQGDKFINAVLNNQGYLSFVNGLMGINDEGLLDLRPGSYTEVKNAKIDINGKIHNTASGYARIDLINATPQWINASTAVFGAIDMNFIETDPSKFEGKTDAPVIIDGDVYVAEGKCIPQKGDSLCDDSQLKYTLVVEVSSPVFGGEVDTILSATGVKVANGRAYVAYHTNDSLYGDVPYGSLRVFDLSDISNPTLISQADFKNMEFNGVEVVGQELYGLGNNKAGAKLMTASLTNGIFGTTDAFQQFSIPSSSAKTAIFQNNYLWTVSGATNGGYFKLDPANEYAVSDQIYIGERAKYVAQNGSHQVFFAIETDGARFEVANIDGTGKKVYNYPTLTQNITAGKNTIALDDEHAYLALSDQGVVKIILSDGKLMEQFIAKSYRDANGQRVFTEGGLTNAVAVGDCYLYLANGSDGVIVLNKNSFKMIGYFQLSGSANYIHVDNGMVFVANGQNGFTIIKLISLKGKK